MADYAPGFNAYVELPETTVTAADYYSYTDTSYSIDPCTYSDDSSVTSSDTSTYTAPEELYSSFSDLPRKSKWSHGLVMKPSNTKTSATKSEGDATLVAGQQPSSKEVHQFTERDWNKEFQTIMDNAQFLFTEPAFISAAQGGSDNFSALSLLADDFIYAAKLYAKVIISELHVPVENKTIKPVKIGGVAGGDKYICGGILFKFALDTRGLYGGDEFAMKAGSHELKGLQWVFQSGVSLKLHFPLMAVIDYRGYRVVAMSRLPIGSKTIIYGSADAGATVHAKDPKFNAKMEQVGISLNLAAHRAGPTKTIVHGPADIEGHKSEIDGRYYLLDYARLMPPQVRVADLSDSGGAGEKRKTHLYQLLRPEFVLTHPVPLSSDALTGMAQFDPDRAIHNAEAIVASKRLFEHAIPALAQHLCSMDAESLRGTYRMCGLSHAAGVNLRHLGRVYLLIPRDKVAMRTVVMTEMAARAMKDHIKAQLRSTMARVRVPSEGPYRQEVIQIMNRAFVTDSDAFWNTKLPEMICFKYDLTLDHVLGSKGEDNALLVNKEDFLLRIQDLAGVKFAAGVKALLTLGTSLLTGRDIELGVIVRNLNIVDQSAACSLGVQALRRDGSESQRIFAQAYSYFVLATSTASRWSTYYQWGALLHALSVKIVHMLSGKESLLVLREAILRIEQSIYTNKTFHGARVECILASIRAILHPGRTALKTDSECDIANFLKLATGHMSAAIQLECLPQFAADPSTQRSVKRLKSAIAEMDAPYLACMAQILLNCSNSKTISATASRRSLVSSNTSSTSMMGDDNASKRSFSEVNQSYLDLVANRLSKLKILNLGAADHLSAKTIKFLFQTLSPSKIRHISLIGSPNLTTELFQSLVSDSLCSFSAHNCAKLMAIPKEISSVKKLVLSGSSLNDDQLSAAIPMLKRLKQLDLSNCKNITAKIFDKISKAKLPRLATLIVALTRTSATMTSAPLDIHDPNISVESLTELNLSGVKAVTNKCLQRIADSASGLTSLNLSMVGGVTDSTLHSILKKCTALESLDLSSTEVTNATLKAIGQNITSLKTLSLRQNHGLQGDCGLSFVLKSNPNLASLDFGNLFKIKDSTFDFLKADDIGKFTNLRELNIDLASELSDASVQAISKAFPELRSLSITGFSSFSAATLIDLSNHNTKLEKLGLTMVMGLTSEIFTAIFSKCTNLTSISLGGSRVTDRVLSGIAKHLTSLTELNISDLKYISRPFIQQVLQRNVGMKKLIAFGTHVPGSFMYQECRHNCPELDIVMDSRMIKSPCLWKRPEEVLETSGFRSRIRADDAVL